MSRTTRQPGISLPTSRWTALRAAVWARDQGVCGICGEFAPENDFEADHIVPVSAGGIDCMDNLRATHPSCNRIRGGQLGGAARKAHKPPHLYFRVTPTCGDHCGAFVGMKFRAELWQWLSTRAKSHGRSVYGELIAILERAVADEP